MPGKLTSSVRRGAAVLYVLVALIACAIGWASVAKIDRIVVAQGKLVTTAATIVVQPLETSVVRSLLAQIGESVHEGDALATLDPTFSKADQRSCVARLPALTHKSLDLRPRSQ